MSVIDLRAIVEALNRAAPQLAPELLPGGVLDRPHWRCGGIDGRAPRHSGSFVLNLSGAHVGQWRDFSDGSHGDMLDLVAYAKCGGSKGEAVIWARRWLGLDTRDPKAIERAREAATRAEAARAETEAAAQARKRAAAKALWLAGRESLLGTPADWYLRGRAIALAQLPAQPGALRFHPAVWCAEVNAQLPAMLGCIVGADGHGELAVHRTWLGQRPDGSWGKAALRQPKKVLGACSGGVIPITRGPSGRRLAAAPAGDRVLITEGIEDALTLATEPEGAAYRILAAISVGNLARLALPEAVAEVTLALDRDGENDTVRRAVEAALRRFGREGRRVRIARPPEGFKDFNALAMHLAAIGAQGVA